MQVFSCLSILPWISQALCISCGAESWQLISSSGPSQFGAIQMELDRSKGVSSFDLVAWNRLLDGYHHKDFLLRTLKEDHSFEVLPGASNSPVSVPNYNSVYSPQAIKQFNEDLQFEFSVG